MLDVELQHDYTLFGRYKEHKTKIDSSQSSDDGESEWRQPSTTTNG